MLVCIPHAPVQARDAELKQQLAALRNSVVHQEAAAHVAPRSAPNLQAVVATPLESNSFFSDTAKVWCTIMHCLLPVKRFNAATSTHSLTITHSYYYYSKAA